MRFDHEATINAPASVVWHRDSYVTKQSMGFARRDFYNMRNAVLCARKYLPRHQLPLFAFSMSKYVGYVTLRSLFQADFKRAAGLYRGLWNGCWTTSSPSCGKTSLTSMPDFP